MRGRSRLTALLGPTNTGKTFFAIERMLGHASGIIGFPLRLLARENYERILKLKGAGQVALVTGEEKIIPPGARYFCCTVESMPLDRVVDFLAVDEIQLCGDHERGHIFTDRLLHARGESETIFLGSDTIRPILQRMVPDIEFISRPRFSTLTYTGRRKLTRLPPKTAVIAFSAAEVYEMAELLRRQRGGTAVVLGALSPRARNAQVALFEAGEVDYLVATDAIGMGLNLSLDHVAFARLSKFDGRYPRPLSPAEIGQIAGRAGRHMKDGTFGTTNEQPDLPLDLVEAVENHRFPSLPYLYWRNPALDFSNPRSLLRSLERRTPNPDLMRVRDAEDAEALAVLSRDPDIDQRARGLAAVKLLWDVCQIPDFSKNLTDQHTRLLTQVYRYLIDDGGRLPTQWVAGQIQRLDRSDGDIDVLTTRLAQVRTWTYITHRGDWVENSGEWQDRARALEDRISDALHERLTERFVDRRAALFAKRLSGGEKLWGAIKSTGEVLVEGHAVGKLEAFRFQLDPAITGEDRPAALTAVRRSLGEEIPRRLAKLEDADDSAFQLDASGRITWQGAAVARLAAGDRPLAPRIEPLDSEFLDGLQRERLRRRLVLWLERYLGRRLEPLFALAAAPLPATARGLAFQLVEALGCLPRAQAHSALSTLGRAERKALTQLGVRIGRESLYLVGLFKAKSIALRALLWSVRQGSGDLVRPAPEVQATVLVGPAQPGFLSALGYLSFERKGRTVVIRADMLERLLDRLDRIGGDGAFQVTASLEHASGCDASTLSLLLPALGYRPHEQDGKIFYRPPSRGARHRRQNRGFEKAASGNPDSPFAKLKDLGLKS